MKYLVTGAQGFIGRYLVARLLSDGAEVVGLGRSARCETFTHSVKWAGATVFAPLTPPLAKAFANPFYRYCQIDLCDAVAVQHLLATERFDMIFHLAGALRDSPIEALTRSNIVAMQVLIDAVATLPKPPRIIYASSGSVVGPVSEEQLPIRADPDGAVMPVDAYAVTKRAAEDLARLARQRNGGGVVTARVFAVVGPGQEERHLCGHLAQQFAERKAGVSGAAIKVGPLNTTRDFCDVRDVAEAFVCLAQAANPPVLCNIASGRETLTADVFQTLASLAGDASKLEPIGPARKEELGRSVADIGPLAPLGYVPQLTLDQSLRDLLDYYLTCVATHG